jgi:hypothetical protein
MNITYFTITICDEKDDFEFVFQNKSNLDHKSIDVKVDTTWRLLTTQLLTN